eukprot:jgi/Hompol1/4620/HPOL_003752-RA
MSAAQRTAPTDQLFSKLVLTFDPFKSHATVEKVKALMERALKARPQAETVLVDKPVDGTLFMFRLPLAAAVPHDGYGWLDDEAESRANLDGGGMPRFLSNGTQGQTLHPGQRINVGSVQAVPSAFGRPMQDTTAAAQASRKKPRTVSSQPLPRPASQVTLIEEEITDEMDLKSCRTIAHDRYKRNHLFIDMLFSPYNAKSIKAQSFFSGIDDETLREMIPERRAYLDTLDAEFAELQDESEQVIQDTRARAKSDWAIIESIRNAKTTEELDKIQEALEKQLGHIVPKTGFVTHVTLPK